MCIALVDDYIVKNNKVVTIILKTNTIKVFKNTIELKNLESVLQDKGYDCIFRSLNTAFPSKIGQVNGEIRPCLRLRRPSAFFNKFLL